ncbi:MAG TPA: hypothetical protein VHB21_12890, partial [Minicystis sp.]|nr:hypothetical protein [Minicystis sp.]
TSPAYVAAGFGRRGLVASDGVNGCRFVLLGPDGAPASTPTVVGPKPCAALVATPFGFDAFELADDFGPPSTLVTIDEHGQVAATDAPLFDDPFGSPIGDAAIRFADGSELVAWRGGQTLAILAAHIAQGGTPLGPPKQLFDLSNDLTGDDFFSMASLGHGALAVFGNDATPKLLVEAVDATGAPGPATSLSHHEIDAPGVARSRAGGGFVSWAAVPSGSAVGELFVRRIDAGGAPSGGATALAHGFLAGGSRVASTPVGDVVAFWGERPGEPTQVYVTRLRCP